MQGMRELLGACRSARLELDVEDLADAVWLASWLPAPVELPEPPPRKPAPEEPEPVRSQEPKATKPPASISPNRPPASSPTMEPAAPRQDVYFPTPGHSSTTPGMAGRPFRSPTGSPLPDALALTRALRPLRRRVASRTRRVLDEERTIRRIVEEGIWLPTLRPERERWLSVALVVDSGGGMEIWRATAEEVRKLLIWLSAFRDVRSWTLDFEAQPPALRAGLFTRSDAPKHKPGELIDTQGRSLIIVLTDCVGEAWHDGRAATILEAWSARGMVALWQMLPEHLWARTALRSADTVDLSASGPGMPNCRLLARPRDALADVDPDKPAFPVLGLEPQAMALWARFIAGARVTYPGFVLESSLRSNEENSSATAIAPQDRLKRFWQVATPLAKKLAGCLAASPVLSLPVIRLVRQAILPSARQSHEAEVLLSGLLRLIPDQSFGPDAEPVYDFYEGVRGLLLDAVPTASMEQVLKKVSAYVEEHLAEAHGFAAMLADPAAHGSELLPARSPFARIAGEVLRRLGGEYERMVGLATEQLPTEPNPDPKSSRVEPSKWVLVTGSRSEEGTLSIADEETRTALLIGKLIAQESYGLVTSGFEGVDERVMSAYSKELEKCMPHAPLEAWLKQVVAQGRELLFEEGTILHPPSNENSILVSIKQADLVIVIGGGINAFDLAKTAIRLGKPVLPLQWTGSAALILFRDYFSNPTVAWESAKITSQEDLAALTEPIDEECKLIRNLLAKNLGRHPTREQPATRVRWICEFTSQGNRIERELPFVIGVLADLSAQGGYRRIPLERRQLIEVSKENFADVLAMLRPQIVFFVPNYLGDGSGAIGVSLAFSCIEDFSPIGFIKQIPQLESLLVEIERLKRDTSRGLLNKAWQSLTGQQNRIKNFEQKFARQVSAVLHHPDFQRLESTWLGLQHLVNYLPEDGSVLVRVLDANFAMILAAIADQADSEEQYLSKWLTNEFRQMYGVPFGLLVINEEVMDLGLLEVTARAAYESQVILVAAASPCLLHLRDFAQRGPSSEQSPSFMGDLNSYLKGRPSPRWETFRRMECARNVCLTLPRIQARLLHRAQMGSVVYDETASSPSGVRPWMNSVWLFAATVAAVYGENGWFGRVNTADNISSASYLPVQAAPSAAQNLDQVFPTDWSISETEGRILIEHGFLPLIRSETSGARYFARPKSSLWLDPRTTGASAATAFIDTNLCLCRFVHCLKIMASDLLRQNVPIHLCQQKLNAWLQKFDSAAFTHGSFQHSAFRPIRDAEVALFEWDTPRKVRLMVSMTFNFEQEPTSVGATLDLEAPS